MGDSNDTRAIYGKAIGTSLAGLAGLAAQGLLVPDAHAEGPIMLFGSESHHKDKINLGNAFDSPLPSEITAGGDLDGDGLRDLLVGSPVGSPDALAIRKGNGDYKYHIIKFATGSSAGVRAADYIKLDPPLAFAALTGRATGSSSHIKLSKWDLDPASPPVTLDEVEAFPGQVMRAGVHVASGDLDGDGLSDLLVGSSGDKGQPGATPGASPVRWMAPEATSNGYTIKLRNTLFPYGDSFTGGVRVATGDVDGDGRADLVTVGEMGDQSEVRVFTGFEKQSPTLFSAFTVDSPGGGLSIAVGDLDGDGRAEIATSAHKDHKGEIEILSWSLGGSPDGSLVPWTLVNTLKPYDSAYDGGFHLAIFDATGDGIADLFAAPASVVPEPASVGLIGAAAWTLRRRRRRT